MQKCGLTARSRKQLKRSVTRSTLLDVGASIWSALPPLICVAVAMVMEMAEAMAVAMAAVVAMVVAVAMQWTPLIG
ncbi:MAG: hypothetical protein ACXW1E_03375 [Halobacteriota archaeon]